MTDSATPRSKRQSVRSRLTRPLEVLPMRVRLVALLVSLLLIALTLTPPLTTPSHSSSSANPAGRRASFSAAGSRTS